MAHDWHTHSVLVPLSAGAAGARRTQSLAEGEGFEPRWLITTAVFKLGAMAPGGSVTRCCVRGTGHEPPPPVEAIRLVCHTYGTHHLAHRVAGHQHSSGSLVIGLGELAEGVGDCRAPALTITKGSEPEVHGLAARVGRRSETAARVVAEQIMSKDE